MKPSSTGASSRLGTTANLPVRPARGWRTKRPPGPRPDSARGHRPSMSSRSQHRAAPHPSAPRSVTKLTPRPDGRGRLPHTERTRRARAACLRPTRARGSAPARGTGNPGQPAALQTESWHSGKGRGKTRLQQRLQNKPKARRRFGRTPWKAESLRAARAARVRTAALPPAGSAPGRSRSSRLQVRGRMAPASKGGCDGQKSYVPSRPSISNSCR